MPFSSTTNPTQSGGLGQVPRFQVIEGAEKRGYTHRVPNTLKPFERQQIIGEVLAGRSIFDTAHTYSTTTAVVCELWCRRLERRLGRVESAVGIAA